jgi:hypothetical protein
MTKYLIEVPHPEEKVACARAIQVFLQTGSHFLVNADWGCEDGDHCAYLIAEAESKEDIQYALPPDFRSEARIVKLRKYSATDIEETLAHHT